MLFNPELRRNITLYFTPHRMILTFAIISIIVYTAHLTNGMTARASASYLLMVFFIFFWGTKNASETVIEEINLKTWDFQRQLPISPWTMTIGKLFGSTLFGWYGAIICIIIYIFSYPPEKNHLGQELFILICGGIFAQAVALLASLQGLTDNHNECKRKTVFYFLLGLIIGGHMTISTLESLHFSSSNIQWFQFTFSAITFSFVSLILFTIWSIIGLQRSFSTQLQYQTFPIAWLGFSLFLILYFSGLSTGFSSLLDFLNNAHIDFPQVFEIKILLNDAPYYVAFFIAEILLYLALFTESLTTIRYKKLILRLQTQSLREMMLALPLWPLSFLLVLGTGIISLLKLSAFPDSKTLFSPSILLITSILFVIRDILLVHYFTFDTRVPGGSKAYLIYLLLLYFLLPGLLIAMDASSFNVILLPSTGQHTLLAISAICPQILFLGYLAANRWLTKIDN